MLEVFFLHLILVIFPVPQLPRELEVAPPPRNAVEPVLIQGIENGVLSLKELKNFRFDRVKTADGPRIRVTSDEFTLEATRVQFRIPARFMNDGYGKDRTLTLTIKDGQIHADSVMHP